MLRTLCCAIVLVAATAVDAAVVPFLTNPSTRWFDGTFTTGLTGAYAGGFYSDPTGPTRAFNGYGQNGGSIMFDNAVEFNSLKLGNCGFCGVDATTITVSLYDGSNGLLTSQTIAPLDAFTLLTFNTGGVRKATFGYTGGTNFFGDGRTVGFYSIHDVTYTGGRYTGTYTGSNFDLAGSSASPAESRGGSAISVVPDPATWALMIAGFGLVGTSLRRRNSVSAA